MASLGLQILGVALAVIGWLGNILICALPLWRVSAFIGNNIVVAQSIWEGLWMSCVVQSTGQMQCKVYDSLLALPPDLQAARAMIVISILFSFFGLLLSVVGGKCTTCIEDETVCGPVEAGQELYIFLQQHKWLMKTLHKLFLVRFSQKNVNKKKIKTKCVPRNLLGKISYLHS
uniref:Claudin n=1 Tax=Poecilia reticulata TaxID=8081 RepID=A0A3P9NWG2_POERE